MFLKIISIILVFLKLQFYFLNNKQYKYKKKNFIYKYLINNYYYISEKNYSNIISKFEEKNYNNKNLNLNYELDNNTKRIYKNIEAINNKNFLHSKYGEKCGICKNLIGEFNFRNYGEMKCPGYPRLYRLSNYWDNIWLLGGNMDDGKIIVRRSKDNGKNWGEPISITFYPDYICSNVNFFELKNHDIICSYRAIGNLSSFNPEIKHNRKLCSSISHDGGKTWENLGDIIDNFNLAIRLGKTKESAMKACENEFKVGFFEPFIENINDNITVFYADDFTTMAKQSISDKVEDNYRAQNIYSQIFDTKEKKWLSERRIILDGTIKRKPTGSEIKKRISRDGMPGINKMKDGTYVLVFEGTYRDRRYPLVTGNYLKEYHAFEILLSYSKDGIIWSNPIEVYTPKNNLSKASAPYIVSTENNQLIISFQTDEDSLPNGVRGDIYSIMKVMISKPGIDIKNINKESFYALCNSNNSPISGTSIWNGMMIVNNILYISSSDNTIKYSEIPIYEDPNKYNDKLKNEYYIKTGKISTFGNKIIIDKQNTLIINKNINTLICNSFYSYITTKVYNNCGLAFGIKNGEENNYYIFMINKEGYLILYKFLNGINIEIVSQKSEFIYHGFDKRNTYKMSIKFIPYLGEIIASINDNIIFYTVDNSLNGQYVGIKSYENGTIFTQILI